MSTKRKLDQSGLVTIDYLFAFVLTMGFVAILFSLSLTLTVASITQYATFAAARGFSSSHATLQEQFDFGNQKFKQIVSNPALASLYGNGWFSIGEPDVGDLAAVRSEFQSIKAKYGVGVQFTAAILDFEIPFFGSTDPESGDGNGKGFQTYISSFTGRENTAEECMQFTSQRWSLIKAMDQRYATGQYNSDRYNPIEDNGC
jgi:hypothetical protein